VKTLTISDVIRRSTWLSPEAISEFHRLRQYAMDYAKQVYADRAASYDVGAVPTSEMAWGAVSLASEMYRRSSRLIMLLTPVRGEAELRQEDVDRVLDTCIDLINYSSWTYALMQIATEPAPVDGAFDELAPAIGEAGMRGVQLKLFGDGIGSS